MGHNEDKGNSTNPSNALVSSHPIAPQKSTRKRDILADIGIPNGPAKDDTRGLLKAHNPKFMKPGSPVKRWFGKI
jgi:hypothetical protein